MKLWTIPLGLMLLIAGIATWLWNPQSPPRDLPGVRLESPAPPAGPLYLADKATSGEPRLGDLLNRPERTATQDLELLKEVLFHFRTVHKENPIGTHEEIVRQLVGGNSRGVAYLSESHPALKQGQLHDRWGTPFYFHQLSDQVMEIRSAGPDRVHWNADDVIVR